MAQPPFQVDALQIEPGSGDTLTISRDATAGAMKLLDAVLTSGILLPELSGLRNITGVHIVGSAGTGAKYTAIQDGVDAVAVTADVDAPELVLVLTGVYTENLLIQKDGVVIMGLGLVRVTPDNTASPTVTISTAVGTTPNYTMLKNLTVEHPTAGEVCVSIAGGASSVVGSTGIYIDDCNLVAAGVGTYQVDADTVNNVYIRGGTWAGSSSSAVCQAANCALFYVSDVEETQNFQVSYDTTAARPLTTTSVYRLWNLGSATDLLSSLSGAGSLTISGCPSMGNVAQAGDRALTLNYSRFGTLTLDDTTAGTLLGSTRGVAAGNGTLQEDSLTSTSVFAAEGVAGKTITFAVDQPDTDYAVFLDWTGTESVRVSSKTAANFVITTSGNITGSLFYTVNREI